MAKAGQKNAKDPLAEEVLRRVALRAPIGFAIFLTCLVLSTAFEVLRFPSRAPLMLGFAAGFTIATALAWSIVRRRPSWSIAVLVVFVNLVGVAVTAYHVLAGASLAMCIWQLTALLGAAAVLVPWGARPQALACIGTLVSYPLHLVAGTADVLTWSAGGTYLIFVSGFSVLGALLFARHVRRTMQLSADLSEREARLQSYFDLSLVGCAILAADATCSEVNDELCRILGFSRAQLLAARWPVFIHADDRPACEELIAQALADGGAAGRRDMRCVRRNGELIHAIVAVRGLPGRRGGCDHVMVLVHDITDRKQAEAERERLLERAENASRAKDEFLATVSHELRTPLFPILGWATLLQRGGLTSEKTSAALAAIERSARTQAQLIDDLLDVSRVITGKWRLAVRPMELAPVVQAAADVVRPAADVKGVELELQLARAPILVSGDPERLQQVVWNLLSNGIKFTPAGGRVSVALEAARGCARIVVRDTGEGITTDFLPHLFEQFRQADSSATRPHGGLGLGLAIVRMLVELHGGTVEGESAGPGQGAVFTVELPLLAESTRTASAGSRAADVPPGISLRGVRILVVDDDPEATAVMSTLLASCGGEVRIAASTGEALATANHWPPDVLVSDLAMPGEDGCALLRKLRARGGALRGVPAVAVTAHAGAIDRLIAAGFEMQIVKPFDPAQLAAAVEKAAVGAARKPEARPH
ncbi:MAG TPA: ATP-binding protein [Candidatus Binatia bacterium]|nr:ATP-binding protein [Candidatus Binatia bacterium]